MCQAIKRTYREYSDKLSENLETKNTYLFLILLSCKYLLQEFKRINFHFYIRTVNWKSFWNKFETYEIHQIQMETVCDFSNQNELSY